MADSQIPMAFMSGHISVALAPLSISFFQPCKFFPTVWSIWNLRVDIKNKFWLTNSQTTTTTTTAPPPLPESAVKSGFPGGNSEGLVTEEEKRRTKVYVATGVVCGLLVFRYGHKRNLVLLLTFFRCDLIGEQKTFVRKLYSFVP